MFALVISLLAAVHPLPSGQHFRCTPTHVWDGDGPIWCAEGPRVRLAGVAARELDGRCKKGHPCPRASALAARGQLVQFLGGSRGIARSGHILVQSPTMTCVSNGSARGDRTGAWCELPGVGDLSCAMIRSGTVLRWARYAGKRCL